VLGHLIPEIAEVMERCTAFTSRRMIRAETKRDLLRLHLAIQDVVTNSRALLNVEPIRQV
jgi:hypothetical protein